MKGSLHGAQLKDQHIYLETPCHISPTCSSVFWSCLDSYMARNNVVLLLFRKFQLANCRALLLAPSSKGLVLISKDLL